MVAVLRAPDAPAEPLDDAPADAPLAGAALPAAPDVPRVSDRIPVTSTRFPTYSARLVLPVSRYSWLPAAVELAPEELAAPEPLLAAVDEPSVTLFSVYTLGVDPAAPGLAGLLEAAELVTQPVKVTDAVSP